MFSADILVLADILTTIYGLLLTVCDQKLTNGFRNSLTLYPFQQIPRPQNLYPRYLQPFPFKALISSGSQPHSLLANCVGVLEECGPDSSLLNNDPQVFCTRTWLHGFIWDSVIRV